MKNLFAILLATTVMASSAHASLLETTKNSNKTIEGVQIASEANVNVDKQQLPVSIVGAALRAKTVLIMKVKVYVIELLSSDASSFVRSEADALNSLDKSRTIAMRMSFLRTLDAATMQQSFTESLNANGVNPNEPAIAQLLTTVKNGGDANSGDTMTVVMQKNADKSETVYFENPKHQVAAIKGPEGFAHKVMSIWLGVTTDSGLETAKQQLIQGL